jgi:hypothetical protein
MKARQKLHLDVSLEQTLPMDVSKCFASYVKNALAHEDSDHQN